MYERQDEILKPLLCQVILPVATFNIPTLNPFSVGIKPGTPIKNTQPGLGK